MIEVITRILTCSRQCVDFISKSLPGSVSYSTLKANTAKIASNLDNQGVIYQNQCDAIVVFDNNGKYGVGTSESTHTESASCISVWCSCAVMSCFDESTTVLQSTIKHSPSRWRSLADDCSADLVLFGFAAIPAIAFNGNMSHCAIISEYFESECQASVARISANGYPPNHAKSVAGGDDAAVAAVQHAQPNIAKMCPYCPNQHYSSRCRICQVCRQPLVWIPKCKGKNTAFRIRKERREMRIAYSTIVKSFDSETQRVVDRSINQAR